MRLGCRGEWAAVLGLGWALAAAAAAQMAPGVPSVARLSWRAGEVSVQRGAAGVQAAGEPAARAPGSVNLPLVAGERVEAAAGARAEVALDRADFLRLDGNAGATLVTLRRDELRASIEHGVADLAVLRGARAQTEIDTPLLALRPRGQGVFRIEVISEDQSVITVRQGAAEVTTRHGRAMVRAGETMTVEGADHPQYRIVEAAAPDGWDAWNAERDRRLQNARRRTGAAQGAPRHTAQPAVL
jgi:hypothetical protein